MELYFCNIYNCLLEKKHKVWDFPGGPVVKNLPSNEGAVGSDQGPKIPHPMEQPRPRTPTPAPLSPK